MLTILNSAESALTWLGQIQGGNPYWPYFQGLSTYYTGYYYGSAGIADVMLQAYELREFLHILLTLQMQQIIYVINSYQMEIKLMRR